MAFQDALQQYFPDAVPEADFVRRSHECLLNHGFDAENTIACVSVCRDELMRSFVDKVQNTWGEAFNFSSLAGMLFLGKTGFLAAAHHAPKQDGIERYVYFALPHIAIGREGEPGLCYRPGQNEPSTACGALLAFREEIAKGHLNLQIDPDDVEQSLLKQRLSRKIKSGETPDIVTLAKICHDTILEDLERMIRLTVNPAKSHYAVLTGIQIHGPDGLNLVWPGVFYVNIAGQHHRLQINNPDEKIV